MEFEPFQKIIDPFCNPESKQHILFGIGPENISVIDARNPVEPKIIDKVET